MIQDINGNIIANNVLDGYTTTATAASTTTLTVASTYQQFFTGTTTQTVVLPVTSTLVLGQSFSIVNDSTGIVTVQSSGANTIQAQIGSTTAIYTCILTSGTTAASWSVTYINNNSGGSGTVNSGTTGQLAYYSATGTAVSGLTTGTGVLTALGINVGSAGAFVTFNGALGTPSSGVLTNFTGTQIGTTAGGNAAAGQVGEFMTSYIANASGVSISSSTPTNMTSLSLTAGDWDVWGNIAFTNGTTATNLFAWISTTSATIPESSLRGGINEASGTIQPDTNINAPTVRISISSTTTVYISGYCQIVSGSWAMAGTLSARRVR